MLVLADRLAGHRGVPVGAGDWFPLHADFLVADRDRGGDVLGDHVLAQPGPSGLDRLGADPQLLL